MTSVYGPQDAFDPSHPAAVRVGRELTCSAAMAGVDYSATPEGAGEASLLEARAERADRLAARDERFWMSELNPMPFILGERADAPPIIWTHG